ncbi:hypothetical protein O1611_g2049 [Lasiodiplodia mahajangana]|uniref:Uncharacterized protein n=1 Tax=Lasiodiplodia mahajangana TaxID=1108764 RepID=A0ACC2JW80_9PEZI|nr:hypothetical protein O1611_g2049 [Lasiodiplodia mahajangana]
MACNPARSLRAAERKALAGENDSEDSQEKLFFLMREHGVGVTTSSPTLGGDGRRWSIRVESTSASTSYPATNGAKQSQQVQSPKDASRPPMNKLNTDTDTDADLDVDVEAAVVSASAPSSVRGSSQQLLQTPRPPPPSLNTSSPQLTRNPAQPVLRDARLVNKSNSHIRDDALTRTLKSTAPLEKQAATMSSPSQTQENEGRSYEQYARDGSQPSSPPGTLAEDHRTLQEGDTGYVNFKYAFDPPDTAPNEPETPFTRNNEHDELHDRSQFTSQTTTVRPNRFAPETPAALPRPFLAGGNGQVMPASQLFGQTQPTSGLKKASPTSSRPSPNVFANNVTSPTNPTSSPLKNRGFGTTPLPTFVSTSPGVPERSSRRLESRMSESSSLVDTLVAGEDLNEDELDQTPLPKLGPRRGRSGLEPIDEYRPYRKRALDTDATRSSSQHSLDSDFERDETELRRQRARLIKERASKSFPEISVSLPSSGKAKIEVPSTNRVKRTKHLRTHSEENVAQCQEQYTTDNGGSQETVADSQDAIFPQKSTNETDTPALPARDHNKLSHEKHTRSLNEVDNKEKEMIPETSPAGTFVDLPKLVGDIMRENSSASSGLLTLSYPTPSARALVEPSSSINKLSSQPQHNTAVAHTINNPKMDPIPIASSPSIVLASSQQSDRRRSRRLNKQVTPSSTAPDTLQLSNPGTGSSTLTVLSATPVISNNPTPNTENNHRDDSSEIFVASSPMADRGRRRARPPPPSSLPDASPSSKRLKTYASSRQGFKNRVRQSSRHSTVSLDELDKSPSLSVAGVSRTISRKPPRKSTTLREFQSKGGIFEGMVFAISFQERPQGSKCKDKSPSKRSIEDMIRQEGGRILDDGFNTLLRFDMLPTSVKVPSTPILSSSLKLLDDKVGFAALIADGHSRKVKYMQALALGIPCLAPRWVTTCISKKEIVDWSSYLLCAGASTLLGDAIRSRNLLPYDASTAKLAQVISQRPKLLDKSNILFIMKKTKNEEKRLPYVFLAQVLGASLVRVYSIEEARARLREAESGHDAFDWVYVDDQIQDARSALFGSGPSEGASKKRKRVSSGTDLDDPPPKRIRTLNDELVIQSLILGRLIEEDELED